METKANGSAAQTEEPMTPARIVELIRSNGYSPETRTGILEVIQQFREAISPEEQEARAVADVIIDGLRYGRPPPADPTLPYQLLLPF